MAWTIAALQRMDAKKFPKTPDEIYGVKPQQSEQQLITVLDQMVASQEREKSGKKRKPKVIHRPA